MSRRVLVTGAAGFVGYHLCERLLDLGAEVVGADVVSDYYSVRLKHARLDRLRAHSAFSFEHIDLADSAATAELMRGRFDAVVHLAAQAGVRYSLTAPHTYIASNVTALLNVLEGLRGTRVPTLYASSSSVYGDDTPQPFHESAAADAPVSLYAATKRAGELMASSYAHLFGIPLTGLRFFTVYGPWGRPDMAYFKFSEAIVAGEPIDLYGDGLLARDFTEISDIVEALVRLLDHAPTGPRPHRVLNVGAGQPVRVLEVVAALERAFGLQAVTRSAPLQPGDVTATWADTTALEALTGFRPSVTVQTGTTRFAEWFQRDWPALRSQT